MFLWYAPAELLPIWGSVPPFYVAKKEAQKENDVYYYKQNIIDENVSHLIDRRPVCVGQLHFSCSFMRRSLMEGHGLCLGPLLFILFFILYVNNF